MAYQSWNITDKHTRELKLATPQPLPAGKSRRTLEGINAHEVAT